MFFFLLKTYFRRQKIEETTSVILWSAFVNKIKLTLILEIGRQTCHSSEGKLITFDYDNVYRQ